MVVLFVLVLHLSPFVPEELALELFHHFDIRLRVALWVLFCVSLFVDFDWLAPNILDALLLASLFVDALEFLNVLLDPLFHAGVPVILNCVVSSAFEHVGNV